MNQYEIDAADMLAVAYLENRGDEFNAACKVLGEVMRKRDEDVQLLMGELKQNSDAWKQAQEILESMRRQGEQALAESERLSAESEAKLAAGLAAIDARHPAAPASSLIGEAAPVEQWRVDWALLKEAQGAVEKTWESAKSSNEGTRAFEAAVAHRDSWAGHYLSRILKNRAALSAAPSVGVGAAPVGWIPVSERLPEPGVPVLICEHRDDCPISLAEYLPDEVDEDDPDKWEYGYGEWGRPSFWMPLPAQPIAQQKALCAKLAAPTTTDREEQGNV